MAALSACSGGGSDAPPVQPAPNITAASALGVAAVIVNGGGSLARIPGAGGFALTDAASGSDDHQLGARAVLARHLEELAARPLSMVRVTETTACENGGTVTTIFDDNDDNGELSMGDLFEFRFDQCVEGEVVLSGSVLLDQIVVSSATAELFDFAARSTYDLQISSGAETTAIAMQVRLTIVVTPDQLVEALELLGNLDEGRAIFEAGSRFELIVAASTSTTRKGSVRIFGGPILAATAGAGATTRNTSVLPPALAYETTLAFSRDGGGYPSAGALVVTAPDGSRLRLTTLDDTAVRIEVDEQGDGEFEFSTVVAWSDLDGAALD
ncbi:MAG: hypothetical protein WAT39_06120 [Planctomycetota bacterium]